MAVVSVEGNLVCQRAVASPLYKETVRMRPVSKNGPDTDPDFQKDPVPAVSMQVMHRVRVVSRQSNMGLGFAETNSSREGALSLELDVNGAGTAVGVHGRWARGIRHCGVTTGTRHAHA